MSPTRRDRKGASGATAAAGDGGVEVAIARVYDKGATGGHRLLVDRLWPRGVAKEDAPFEEWLKDVAPSPELRKWYGHVPERYAEFARRYRAELSDGQGRDALDALRHRASKERVVLVTATKDLEHSGAAVLRDLLAEG